MLVANIIKVEKVKFKKGVILGGIVGTVLGAFVIILIPVLIFHFNNWELI